jgi:hypothetical protein
MVEEAMAAGDDLGWPRRAEVEYRAAIERGDAVRVAVDRSDGDRHRLWVFDPTAAKRVYATALVTGLVTSSG